MLDALVVAIEYIQQSDQWMSEAGEQQITTS
jgi:hypothetical protein